MTDLDRQQKINRADFLERQEQEQIEEAANNQFFTEEAPDPRIEAVALAAADQDGRPAPATGVWLKRDVYMREARRFAAMLEAYNRAEAP